MHTPPIPDDADFSRLPRSAISDQHPCAQADGAVRRHMSTANTARDMDVVRAALGEERINHLGRSYGTSLGAVHGSLFPERLDRSVLDSAVHSDGVRRDVFTLQAPLSPQPSTSGRRCCARPTGPSVCPTTAPTCAAAARSTPPVSARTGTPPPVRVRLLRAR